MEPRTFSMLSHKYKPALARQLVDVILVRVLPLALRRPLTGTPCVKGGTCSPSLAPLCNSAAASSLHMVLELFFHVALAFSLRHRRLRVTLDGLVTGWGRLIKYSIRIDPRER